MPERVQLRRTAGWRMPEGAIKVDRTTRWGNPWRVEHLPAGSAHGVLRWSTLNTLVPLRSYHATEDGARAFAIERFGFHLRHPNSSWVPVSIAEVITTLGGHDLACWCPLDKACHADLLLTLANPGTAA